MKRWIHCTSNAITASSISYDVEVVPECNDEFDNPCCWGLKFYDDSDNKHFVWITKYDDKEYIVEDSNGSNLAKDDMVFKTFTGAKKRAEEIMRNQVMRDIFSD